MKYLDVYIGQKGPGFARKLKKKLQAGEISPETFEALYSALPGYKEWEEEKVKANPEAKSTIGSLGLVRDVLTTLDDLEGLSPEELGKREEEIKNSNEDIHALLYNSPDFLKALYSNGGESEREQTQKNILNSLKSLRY